MKKTYCRPQAEVVEMADTIVLLAASNYPEERGNQLYWGTPDDEFDEDEEIA